MSVGRKRRRPDCPFPHGLVACAATAPPVAPLSSPDELALERTHRLDHWPRLVAERRTAQAPSSFFRSGSCGQGSSIYSPSPRGCVLTKELLADAYSIECTCGQAAVRHTLRDHLSFGLLCAALPMVGFAPNAAVLIWFTRAIALPDEATVGMLFSVVSDHPRCPVGQHAHQRIQCFRCAAAASTRPAHLPARAGLGVHPRLLLHRCDFQVASQTTPQIHATARLARRQSCGSRRLCSWVSCAYIGAQVPRSV